jgi:phage terminase small subunit
MPGFSFARRRKKPGSVAQGCVELRPCRISVQSPYLSIANRQAEIMMRIASEFGFAPASRRSGRSRDGASSCADRVILTAEATSRDMRQSR